ncbi:MAG: hypothetical protein QW334_00090 [Thermofilum sp.]
MRIRFGQLTAGELIEIQKQPAEEQNYHIVYRMLKKAYSDITLENVKNMDGAAFVIIMEAMYKKTNFFRLPRASSR